jgi:hypothetical protein
MKVLVSSILLVMLAIGSTGCVALDCYHDRGNHFGRRPPIVRPERLHGHDYGPPERYHDSRDVRGHR